MAKKQKMPQQVFVRYNYEGTKDEFLSVNENPTEVLDGNEDLVTVGIYKLTETVKVKRFVELVRE